MCKLFALNKIREFPPKLLGERMNTPLAKEASSHTYIHTHISGYRKGSCIYGNDNNQATSVNKGRKQQQ